MFEKCGLCRRSAGLVGAGKAGFAHSDLGGVPLQLRYSNGIYADEGMIWLCPDCLAAVKARVEQEEQSERDRLAQLEREQRFARLASDRDVEGLIEALREAYVDDEFTFVTGWRGGKEGPAQSMGEALLRCGAAAVEPLIAVVEDRGGHPVGLREFAVFLLGELKDKRALAALSNVAEHEQDQRTTRPEQVETHIVAAAEAAIGKIERRWEGSRR